MRPGARAIAAAALAFTACTHVQPANTTAGKNAWTIPGTLRLAQREDPDNLNMLLGAETVDADIAMFWGAYLARFDDKNELVPELAERMPSLENGDIDKNLRSITYHLRRGVMWQDGSPFSADDVIFTWHAIMNPQNHIVSRVGYDVIDTIEKRDPYTIVVHLKRPFAPFVSSFFSIASQANCILPQHLLARYPNINRIAYNAKPVGTGPFRIDSYEPGARVVLVANDRYWRGPPKLRRIDFNIIASDNTMLTMMQSHQLDFFYRAPETMVDALRTIPGTRLVETPLSRFADIGFNASNPALADRRVRQALAYGTNREALIEKIAHGVAERGDTFVPSFSWANDPHITPYRYDPARARALLDSAGWRAVDSGTREKGGVPLALEIVSFTGSQTNAKIEEFLQEQWKQLGVDATIKNFPSGQLYATVGAGGIEQSGKFDVIIENWANQADPDDSILMTCAMAPPNGWNVYHFCNRDLDRWESIALTNYDRTTRRDAYSHIERIVNDELPFFVFWYQRQLDVINTDLKNYRPAHAVTPFWNPWEWSI